MTPKVTGQNVCMAWSKPLEMNFKQKILSANCAPIRQPKHRNYCIEQTETDGDRYASLGILLYTQITSHVCSAECPIH